MRLSMILILNDLELSRGDLANLVSTILAAKSLIIVRVKCWQNVLLRVCVVFGSPEDVDGLVAHEIRNVSSDVDFRVGVEVLVQLPLTFITLRRPFFGHLI